MIRPAGGPVDGQGCKPRASGDDPDGGTIPAGESG